MALIFIPLVGFATGSLMGNESVPVQMYQSAGSTNPKSSTPVQKQKKPKPSPHFAASRAALASQPKAQQSPAHQQASPKILSPRDASLLQSELDRINQNNLSFQQKTEERLIQLNSQNQKLQHRIQQLTEAMMLLNREVAKKMPYAPPKPIETVNRSSSWSHLENHFGSTGLKITIVGVAIILLLLLWTVWPGRKKKNKRNKVASNTETGDVLDDTKDEYDYMGSAESIPAKLNLVRTYIAMEDYKAAKKVLTEILKDGDKQQKQEASDMLAELPAES